MVMPAIHKSRQQVGTLFTETHGCPVSREDIAEQVGVARRELRRDFLEAGLGVSGANALIAESGTVMFIENEGNARLVTSLPRVHVVLAGIEKLVPDYAAAMLQFGCWPARPPPSLLPRTPPSFPARPSRTRRCTSCWSTTVATKCARTP